MSRARYPATSQAAKFRRLGLPVPDDLRPLLRAEAKARRRAEPSCIRKRVYTTEQLVEAVNASATMQEAAGRLGLRRASVTSLHRYLRERGLCVVRRQFVQAKESIHA